MKNSAHINKLVSNLNVTLRRISKIRNNIDYEQLKSWSRPWCFLGWITVTVKC